MNSTTHGISASGTRLERAGLAALFLFTVAAVAGYGIFALHPERLVHQPRAAAVYGAAFVVFARGQVLLAAAALGIVLVRRAGKRWLGAFAAVYLASLSSELAGTTVGLPFGPYSYTDGLGPKWFGHVPLLIPLSWFLMAVPSYAVASRLVSWNPSWTRAAWPRVLAGSFALLSWDLALDPAMSHATKYWVWGASGSYYGMPWLNLFGWYVTGLVLMTILVATRADRWIADIPQRWLALFYAANVALPLGLCAASRLDGAVLASVIPLALCAAAFSAGRTQGASQRTARSVAGAS